MSGKKAKKVNQRNLRGGREGEGEKTVPASSEILYRKHSPLVGQRKRSQISGIVDRKNGRDWGGNGHG
jgi:hypothetical protein